MKRILIIFLGVYLAACGTAGEVVRVIQVSEGGLEGLGKETLDRIAEVKEEKEKDRSLKTVIEKTPNYTAGEYLALNPEANSPTAQDYRVGGYDLIDIAVYEEPDLSRRNVRVSADGYITFPLIGRVIVDGKTPSDIERIISNQLSEGQYILDANVSVIVAEYNSRKFMVLGSVRKPGSYPLQAEERVLDAVSKAGGIDFEQGGKGAMIIRTENPNTDRKRRIVIFIEISNLLKGGDQLSNLLLADKDVLYIPKADFYYVIGQVGSPGKYPYQEREISIVEAISAAHGFTRIAARNRTRIIRVENGVEKIIQVKVDAITQAGKKLHDIKIFPGDIIVVPESYF